MNIIETFNKLWADKTVRVISITVIICAVLFQFCG